MRLVSLHMRGISATNDILSIKWRYYDPEQNILNYWEKLLFYLLSYYILLMDNFLLG